MLYKSIFPALMDIRSTDIPIIIPTFNQPSLLSLTLDQINLFGLENHVVIYDNNSTYEPMIDLLNSLSNSYAVIKSEKNNGPRIFTEDTQIMQLLPKYYIVTDPDLTWNEYLPLNFIDELIETMNKFNLAKAGFAIEIYDEDERSMFQDADRVTLFEEPYWKNILGKAKDGSKIFDAWIDTTFSINDRDACIKHRSFGKETFRYPSARLADNFTCRHLGWRKKELLPQTKDEIEFYLNNQKWSHTEIFYYGDKP